MINYFATVWSAILGSQIPVIKEFSSSEVPLTVNERASYAGQALRNPVFQDAVADIRKEMISRWANTASGQIEDRELLYVHIRALDYLMTRLAGYISEAKIEEDIRSKQQGIKEPE